MTFFGEVLPVVSRALDEDECEEIIPQLIWKPSELLDADCKIEGDIDLISIIITGKPVQDFVCDDDLKLFGTFYEEFKLFSTDTLQTKEIGRVYLDENSSEKKRKVVSCVFNKNSCPENTWDISSAVLDLNKGQVLKVAVFESKPRALYQDEVNNKNELESVLKVLKTSNYEKAAESGSVLLGSDLEQPNVVGGLSAAVLSDCELQNIPCKLYLCYSDVINSHVFENTLLQDELVESSVTKVTKNIFTESPGFSQSSLYT